MKALIALLPLLAGCVTTGGTTPTDYCAQVAPWGTNAYANCVMQRDAQRQAVGMQGVAILQGMARSWDAPRAH